MAASGPSQPIEKATGWKIPGALTKHVILDPGIAYATADVLLFAGTNPVGLAAMLTATGMAATFKTVAAPVPVPVATAPVTALESPKVVFNQQAPVIIARSEEAVALGQEIGQQAAKKAAKEPKERPPTEEEKLHDVQAPAVRREEIDSLDLQKAFGVKAKVQPPANENENEKPAAEASVVDKDPHRRPKKPNTPAA